ncbi:MAG: arginine--tRNA ligase [Candidatus Omnitrophica bacterium]|nr:arginine--tRNA ligase [Candidatus Omnitrophota bacterium]
MIDIEERLISYLKKIAEDLGFGGISVEISTPRAQSYGDLSSNIALKLSSCLGKKPQDVASDIISKLCSDFSDIFEKIELAEPGFINFYFSSCYLNSFLADLLKEREDYFSISAGDGEKVLIEFVSANPTGPLSIAHGRQAAIGASLARILKVCGYKVIKEYYINDEGNQIVLLGESLRGRCFQLLGENTKIPENGYQGDYLIDLARQIIASGKLSLDALKGKDKYYFSEYAVEHILTGIKKSLSDFGVDFDLWISQKDVASKDKISQMAARFKDKGLIYDKDGALWFKSSLFGDDQDRVIQKNDGEYTYFAADIVYHENKYCRDYGLCIDIWGPDHHGYIERVMSAVEALGYERNRLKILIVQLATLYRAGQLLKLSTRKGETITLDEVVSEIGKDAALYFLLSRKLDSHLDFDLELAKKQTPENPVYYIQYAHARISSMLSHSLQKGLKLQDVPDAEILSNLKDKDEKDLLRSMMQFKRIIRISALTMEPSLVASYLHELAQKFHGFYNKHRVITEDLSLSQARLYLCQAAGLIFKDGLSLLGISAPDNM